MKDEWVGIHPSSFILKCKGCLKIGGYGGAECLWPPYLAKSKDGIGVPCLERLRRHGEEYISDIVTDRQIVGSRSRNRIGGGNGIGDVRLTGNRDGSGRIAAGIKQAKRRRAR